MKNIDQACCFWSRGRFLTAVAVLFGIQVGLILLFSDRSLAIAPPPVPAIRFQALPVPINEDQLLRQYFVGDPAVFPLPNTHGFSGRGWMSMDPPVYKDKIQLEPPVWLNLNPAHLGTNFPSISQASEMALSGLSEQKVSHEEPWPVFLPVEFVPTQSIFRLEGGLADRLLALPPLRSWPSERLLTKSVVQIAVNPTGDVVAAKLDAGSGSPEADAAAVASARALRFRPSNSLETKWGNAIFQWQTLEPAATVAPK